MAKPAKEITMFTWNGKKYTVEVDEDQYKSAVKEFGSVEAVYDVLTEILYKQRDPDTGELKYPELQPMPEITDADREADKRWFNERLRDPNFAMWHGRLGEELSPSDMKIEEWKEKYPGADKFYSSMLKYASIQGSTYGLGEDFGLQGDIRAYKYFAHHNPGMAHGTELATSLPTSFGLTGLTRLIAPKIAGLAWPSIREAVPKSASAGRKFIRIMRNMGLTGAETMAHMFGWRFGHTMPEDPEDPFTADRLKQSLVGDHALRDYSLAFGLGFAIPGLSASAQGLKNTFKNISRRTSGGEGSYELLIQRASQIWNDSIPWYAKQGVSEDAMWGALHNQMARENGDIVSAVVQTQRNLINILENRGAPAFQDLPIARIAGEASGKAPIEATTILKDRVAELATQNARIRHGLLEVGGRQTPSGGVLLSDPEGSANNIIKGHKARAKDAYKELEDVDTIIRRDVVEEFITPGELGKDAPGYIDKAWDDTIRELDKILATPSGRAEYIKNYGRLPRTLLPRDQFLDSPTAVLDPLVAQMISQNARKYAKYSTEALAGRTVEGAPTFREVSAVNAERKAFDQAIGDEIPGYRTGNEAYAEAEFIEDALDSAKKIKGVLSEEGTGYDTFNTWLKEWEALNGRSVGIWAKDDAMRVFLSRTALDFMPSNVTPRMILDSRVAQERIRAFIGNDEHYTNFMNKMVDEQVAQEVTESFPAATRQLMSRGATGTEQALASPSFFEQLPHTAAMLAFSPAFAGGRIGGQQLSRIKGLESEAVSKAAVERMLSRDPRIRRQFVEDLQAGVANIRSPIDIGSQASLAAGTIPPLTMESDFDIYGMPERDRKKELQFLFDKLSQPRVY